MLVPLRGIWLQQTLPHINLAYLSLALSSLCVEGKRLPYLTNTGKGGEAKTDKGTNKYSFCRPNSYDAKYVLYCICHTYIPMKLSMYISMQSPATVPRLLR